MRSIHNFLEDEVKTLSFEPLGDKEISPKVKLADKRLKKSFVDPRSDFSQRSSPLLRNYMDVKSSSMALVRIVLCHFDTNWKLVIYGEESHSYRSHVI